MINGNLVSVGIETVEHTDDIYDPSSVYVEIAYAVRRTRGVYPSGAPQNVEIYHNDRIFVDAFFAPGRSEFRGKAASGEFVTVRLLDEAGNQTTDRPAFFELKTSDGDLFRFHARAALNRPFGVLTEWQPSGKPAQSIEDMGISIVADENGVIRQVRNPSRTVFVESLGKQAYQIVHYDNRQVSAQPADGLHTVKEGEIPLYRHVFRNPDPSSSSGSLESLCYKNGEFSYRLVWTPNVIGDYDMKELTESGEFLGYGNKRWWGANRDLFFRIDGRKNSEGKFKSYHRTFKAIAGKWMVLEEKVKIEGKVVRETYFTYNREHGPNYGKLTSKYTLNGEWEAFDFDDQGRKILEIVPVASQNEGVETREDSHTETRYFPEKPPENPSEALTKGRVTRYIYADDDARKPSESTLHQDGEFVSRSWFTYNVLHNWQQMTREEISHNPDGKPGDPENEIRFSRP